MTIKEKKTEVVDLLHELFELCLKHSEFMFKQLGITEIEYIFFMNVNKYNNLNILQISNTMNLSQTKISRITEKLVKKGYLIREQQNSDRRSTKVFFTEKGKNLYEQAKTHKCIGEDRIKNILQEEKFEDFKTILKQIIDNYTME